MRDLPNRNLRASHLLLVLGLLVPSWACGGPIETEEASAAGADTAFELASLDGGQAGPGDYAGQVVLIDFWATWCVPCHAQAKVLEAVYDKVRDDVQFLAVDVGEEESMVRGFVEKKPFPYPVLLDPQSRVADSLGVYSLPTLMVIDTEGEVSYLEAGLVSEKQVCRLLEDAGSTATC